MAFNLIPGSFESALFRSDASGLQARLSKINDARMKDRKARNALLRARHKFNGLPEDAKSFHSNNPQGHGLPRSYTIKFDDILPDEDASLVDGAKVVFGQYGLKDGGIILDDHVIQPKDIHFSEALKTYTFDAPAKKLGSNEKPHNVTGYINFTSAKPLGTLGVNNSTYNVTLQPDPIKFSVQVSADAGASFDTAQKKFLWDPKSPKWKAAHWADTMEFWYDIKIESDLILDTMVYVENYFIDKIDPNPVEFNLTSDQYSTVYTSVMSGSKAPNGGVLSTTVTDLDSIPAASEARKKEAVRSVFPMVTNFQFSPFGDSFVGVYQAKDGSVYAVKGEMIMEDFSLLSALRKPETTPLIDITPAEIAPSVAAAGPVKALALNAAPVKVAAAATPPNLKVTGLLNLSPMVPDPTDPSGFRDSVAQLAMQDFHDIIVYYMDDDLRTTFISSTPIKLPAAVEAIAIDGGEENRKFYKKLQVPYLATFVANSTMPEGTKVNGARADKLLRQLPVDDPVYKRHSDKLYRMRFLEKFPEVQQYLDAQRNYNYDANIDTIATTMKNKLASNTTGINAANPVEYAQTLKKAQDDIDGLAKWAKSKRLYWAFMVLYWVETASLPNWYAQYTTAPGQAGSSLGMFIKNLNGIFGTLENNESNPSGPSFLESFNEGIRLFQMNSIVPQLVDIDKNSSDFNSILKACLYEFWLHYKDSQDQNMRDQAATSLQLYNDERLLYDMFLPLANAQRFVGAVSTWGNVYGLWEQAINKAGWYQKLANGAKLFRHLGMMVAITMIALPIVYGGFDNMSGPVQAQFISAVVRIGGQLTIKLIQGVWRIRDVFGQIGGLGKATRILLGVGDKIYEEAAKKGATRVGSAMGKFFTRTAAQTAEIAAADAQAFTKLQKAFGRNIGEVFGTVCGIALSIVTIVLTALDLAHQTSGLMIASDVFMLMSATIQILTIVAGWVAVAAAAAVEGTLLAAMLPGLTLVASWGGPVAIAFALVGIIFLIIFESLQDRRNPVQKFVDDRCKPAGLYMRYLAIDYFTEIPPKDKSAGLIGVSIQTSSLLTGGKDGYLHVNASIDNPTVNTTPSLEYTANDIWTLYTDGYGNTTISTRKYVDGVVRYIFLASADDGKSLTTLELPVKDDAKYTQRLAKCQWQVEVMADPTIDTNTDSKDKTRRPLEAMCRIRQNSSALTFSELKGAYLEPTIGISDMLMMQLWTVKMQAIGPGTLSYRHNPWKLATNQTGQSNFPEFTPSYSSTGLQWSISPSLADPFELVTAAGSDEGTIRMKTGSAFTKTIPSTTYTVSCTATMANGPSVTRTTTVAIQVDDISTSGL